jgi:valyl-tRNA synthetase
VFSFQIPGNGYIIDVHMAEGAYDPKAVEGEIYRRWEEGGFFNPDTLPGNRTENYIVYMPLPNVTGTLHMGHLLNNTFQDIVIRFERMRGKRALYLPGTDHAGIATQYVVEKALKKEGVSRFDIGREKFIEKVWEWKTEYGGAILNQLRKIGVSADWSRTRFTMDEAYARDVKAAFVHYHEKGLLYRGTRTVNWCPRCGTSLSELELEYRDEETKLWYIKYSDAITVATTRPETMLGDTAVAVNPSDERYTALTGTTVTLPLMNREIPIVADQLIDPKFGTGAVKVTPAHDGADFEIGVRHKLPTIQVIDERARMTAEAGPYAGQKTTEAREKVVEDLTRAGLIEKIEPYSHRVAICYRCGTTIEPIPSLQWFVKMGGLAKLAADAVTNGSVKIRPENFERTYLDWLSSVRDWAVSRQIWWGHQLPVWFCKKKSEAGGNTENKSQNIGDFVVAEEKPNTCPFCKQCDMEQSPDVLDTWFSSALWPFAGFSQDDLTKYYPGSTLITARDIVNLWVARMVFSGLEFKGAVPFSNVYIHGTIQTKDGKRMSKSLGTGIDPLKYIDQYGADAARFAVVWQASGQDIKWDEAAVIAGRKLCNKLWNASKFVLQQTENGKPEAGDKGPVTEADKKILESFAKTKMDVSADIEAFEFSRALHTVYEFFWHEFCDVYIEASKSQLQDEKSVKSTRAILFSVLVGSVKLLHPFMPFVTEAVWEKLPGTGNMLIVEPWDSKPGQ